MTLLDKFKAYLNAQFKLVPMSKEAAELREEMLGNLMSRAMELKAEGLTDDDVYNTCIDSLGDYTEAINALRSPIKTIKDPKFQIGVIVLLTFAMLCVVAFLVIGVVLHKWAVAALTIFPIMAAAAYVYATSALLKRNFRFRKHYTTDLILLTYGAIAMTGLFFILWLLVGVSPAVAWVTFVYIPVWLFVDVICVTRFFRKKKVPFVLWTGLIMMGSVAVYLTAAAVTGLWHPLWIIVMLGVVVSCMAGIITLVGKIGKK